MICGNGKEVSLQQTVCIIFIQQVKIDNLVFEGFNGKIIK